MNGLEKRIVYIIRSDIGHRVTMSASPTTSTRQAANVELPEAVRRKARAAVRWLRDEVVATQ